MSLALTAAAAAVGAAAILYVLKNKKSKPMQTFDYDSIKATLTHADALGPVEETVVARAPASERRSRRRARS